MKTAHYVFLLLLTLSLSATAQVGVGTTTPQAALDVTATDKGMLVPRIALTDIQAAAPVTNPQAATLVNGTLIYNTATAGTAPNNVTPGFYYWQDSGWVALKGSTTLDAAYDDSGSGAGRVITADAGTVEIIGEGGFLVSGNLDSSMGFLLPGLASSNMFFHPGKAAFRAGYVDDPSLWSNSNVGRYSTAFGNNTTASGEFSTSFGSNTTASGMYSIASGTDNTASGLYSTAGGIANVASGQHSAAKGATNVASGRYSTAWGYNSQALGAYSTTIGYGLISQSINEFVIGQYNTNYLTATGFGGITWNVSDRLFVAGNGNNFGNRADAMILYKNGNLFAGGNLTLNGDTASKLGGGAWTATSDSRLKKDVKQFKDGLAQVLAVNPVKYHYNELSGYDTSKEYVGVIAQELQQVAPYMVGNFTKDGTEYLNVDNSAMTYMLINAVKEQQAIIDNQNNKLRAQDDALAAQNERLAVLEKAILGLSGKKEPTNEIVKSE
jgi:hypothetical protein